jgi:hypothetical protein
MISLIEKAAVNKEATEQGFLVVKPLLRKHYCRTNDMVNIYGISVRKYSHSYSQPVIFSRLTCHWIFSNTTGVTSGAKAVHPSENFI